MDRNEFDGLLALKIVAEKRNFRAAAATLRITPSALSQTIKQLESRVGVALLLRTTRSTSLTEAGETFLGKAGPAMEQILEALLDVGTYAKKPSGLLRINTLRYAYSSFLKPRIASFIQRCPEVSVEVVLEDEPTDVLEKGFDAGIRLSDILAKDMVAVKLFGPIQWVVAGSPKYFRKNKHPVHPKDLLSHDCIRVRVGEEIYDRWEFERAGKGIEVQVKGRLILNDPVLATEAALDGTGLVYATKDLIQASIDSGKLEVTLKDFSPTSSGYYLYYSRRSQTQPKLRAFIDHLLETR